MAAPGGSSLFYAGCNGAGLARAEEDPLQQREPALSQHLSRWSPFKGHGTAPRAGMRGPVAGGGPAQHPREAGTGHAAPWDIPWLRWTQHKQPRVSKAPTGDTRWPLPIPGDGSWEQPVTVLAPGQ